MRGIKSSYQIRSRPIYHKENGFRTVPLANTFKRIEKLLVDTGLEVRFEKRPRSSTPFLLSSLRFLAPEGRDGDEIYFGKGLSDNQALASAVMEFIERFSSRNFKDEKLVAASFKQIRGEACDASEFSLPHGSPYTPDLEIDWIWGYSLTKEKPILVPANLVFCPYVADRPEKYICWYDSNGLASGNCIEEAVLHGLLEVVERDAIYIMEYNQLRMPDILVDFLDDSLMDGFLRDLEKSQIAYFIKSINNDIPIPSFGVFLQGAYEGDSFYSYAAGTHLSPRLALSRALTEAAQHFPRCANYEEWLNSGSLDHYHQKGDHEVQFSSIPDLSSDDIKANINLCVDILRKVRAEVFVVDLSLPEMFFPVVRVCVTNLQPYCNRENQRFSRRLFNVPAKLGYRDHPLKTDEIQIRALCGYR